MHGGLLMIIRRYFAFAKPWHKIVITVSLVAVGVTLVALGVFVGAIMAACGLLLGWQILIARRTVRHHGADHDEGQSASRAFGGGH
jgi:hypothetical protein